MISIIKHLDLQWSNKITRLIYFHFLLHRDADSFLHLKVPTVSNVLHFNGSLFMLLLLTTVRLAPLQTAEICRLVVKSVVWI